MDTPAVFYIQFKQKYLFNIGTLCLQDALHRNTFTQHLLSNSSTSQTFQKCWVHTTQSIFVLCAVNVIFGHVPDSCKAMQAGGSSRQFLQPIPWTTTSLLTMSGSVPHQEPPCTICLSAFWPEHKQQQPTVAGAALQASFMYPTPPNALLTAQILGVLQVSGKQ